MRDLMVRVLANLSVTLSLAACLAHDGPDDDHDGHHHSDEFVATALLNEVHVTADANYRYIESNGIPEHQPGNFPNPGNPNTIQPQTHKYRLPLRPQKAPQITSARGQPFGVALNGVPFDPGTAEFWNGNPRWNYDALSGKINLGMDRNNAHVQPDGAYHYHGLPTGLIESLRKTKPADQMLLVGYGADGFPIYAVSAYTDANDVKSPLKKMSSSFRLKRGTRPDGPGGAYDGTFVEDWEFVEGVGDLDECNGHTGITPEFPEGTYYYMLTETFPFIPRNYRGTPDASFERQGPPPGMGGRPGPGGGFGPPPGGRRGPPPGFGG